MDSTTQPNSAYYKIVKTKSGKGARTLSLAPASWVNDDGVLSWPRLKSDSKAIEFMRNHVAPGSLAGVEWEQCPAKVLKSNIANYDDGMKTLKDMLKESDSSASSSSTDFDDNRTVNRRRQRRTTKENKCIDDHYNYSELLTVSKNKT